MKTFFVSARIMGRETAGPGQTGRKLDELGGKRKILAIFVLILFVTLSFLHMVNISYGPEIQKSDSGKRHRKRPEEKREKRPGSPEKRPEKKPPLMESAPEHPELPSTEEILERRKLIYQRSCSLIEKLITLDKKGLT